MSGFDFPGGVGHINIQDTAALDGSGSINIDITNKQFSKEGSEFPDPEAITSELGDDREGRLGLNQDLSIRVLSIPTGDFDTLEQAAEDFTDLWIEVESFNTVKGSDTPKVVAVYKEVLLSNATHGPIKVDRDAYGVSIFDGRCTGYRTSDIMEVTTN